PMDMQTRRDFYTPAELDAMVSVLPADLQQRYASYVDGINTWVSHVQMNPGDLPAEFPATADQPTPFTVRDLAAIGVYIARSTLPALPIHVGGSYMVARSDPRTHTSYFFNGPELGFSAPEELYELEVHAPGLDVRGITAPGAPVIAIGHNEHVAWGLTSGLSQTNALYAEKL